MFQHIWKADQSASRIKTIRSIYFSVFVTVSIFLCPEPINRVHNELRNMGHLIPGTFTKDFQNRQTPRPLHRSWGAIDKSWRPTGRRENIGWPCLTPGVRGSTSATVGSLEERVSPLSPQHHHFEEQAAGRCQELQRAICAQRTVPTIPSPATSLNVPLYKANELAPSNWPESAWDRVQKMLCLTHGPLCELVAELFCSFLDRPSWEVFKGELLFLWV